MSQLTIIADDLTGAADTGAPFAQAGWDSCLFLTNLAQECGGVVAVSSESRHLPPGEAQASVARLARSLPLAPLVFKKIDSTLRGQPAAELAALLDSLGLQQALVAPAFPEQGRTTVGGRQLVNGVALEQTAFAADIASSDLSLLLAANSRLPLRLAGLDVVRRGPAAVCRLLEQPGLVVADAEIDADLEALAQAALRCSIRLLCGSAGLARALQQALPRPADPYPRANIRPGPALIVAGSRHPRTQRQVQTAEAQGFAVIKPDEACLTSASACRKMAERLSAALAGGQHCILTTHGIATSPLGEQAVARSLAQIAALVLAMQAAGVLGLTGGDTASATLNALDAGAVRLRGEVQPGTAWGTLIGGRQPGLPVVTKAGGFGGDDIFLCAARLAEPCLATTT